MPIAYADSFDRSADGVLDTSAYPTILGAAPNPGTYDESVLRLECLGGCRLGWAILSPNYAVEVTLAFEAVTSCYAAYVFARWQTANGACYAAVLSVSDAAGNVYVQDGTVDAPVLAADMVYLVKFDGTDATVLASAAFTFVASTDYRVRFAANGDRLTLAIDGVQLLSASDSTWRTANWTFGTFGLAVDSSLSVPDGAGGASGECVVDFDDLSIDVLEEQIACRAAYDESRKIIRFSLPAAGSEEPQQLFCYHLESGAWTIEDLPTSSLGEILDPRGMIRTIYGRPDDGKVWQFDETATRSGSMATARYQTNWLQLHEDKQRVMVEQIAVWLERVSGLDAEVIVETCDDPSDERTFGRRSYVTRFNAGEALGVGRLGRFVRFEVRHADSGSTLALRRAVLTVLE